MIPIQNVYVELNCDIYFHKEINFVNEKCNLMIACF